MTATHPIVTIDPDVDEHVDSLWLMLAGSGYYKGHIGDLVEVLREYAANPTPARPDEPLGLGAVVEDADGRRWVRASYEDPEWRSATEIGTWNAYADINAARVLSDGLETL